MRPAECKPHAVATRSMAGADGPAGGLPFPTPQPNRNRGGRPRRRNRQGQRAQPPPPPPLDAGANAELNEPEKAANAESAP